MKILKGTKLIVNDSRKGVFSAIATEDFDTDQEWYPLVLDEDTPVLGLSNKWYKGDEIPCRKGIAVVKIKEV